MNVSLARGALCAAGILAASAVAAPATAQPIPVPNRLPAAGPLLERSDAAMTLGHRKAKVVVEVESDRESPLRIEGRLEARKPDEAFLELDLPEAEAGSRFQYLPGTVYTFIRSEGQVAKLAGPQLDLGFFLSDVTYRDLFGAQAYARDYEGRVVGSDRVEGQDAWLVEMVARRDGDPIGRRRVWVHKEHEVPIKEELLTRTGKPLKTRWWKGLSELHGRQVPTVLVVDDPGRAGVKTTVTWTELELDAAVRHELFDPSYMVDPR